MTERCMDCLLDATHTLQWHATRQAWSANRFGPGTVRPWNTIHRYCRWHASCRAIRRNARGVRPAMQQLRRVLQRQEVPHGPQDA